MQGLLHCSAAAGLAAHDLMDVAQRVQVKRTLLDVVWQLDLLEPAWELLFFLGRPEALPAHNALDGVHIVQLFILGYDLCSFFLELLEHNSFRPCLLLLFLCLCLCLCLLLLCLRLCRCLCFV